MGAQRRLGWGEECQGLVAGTLAILVGTLSQWYLKLAGQFFTVGLMTASRYKQPCLAPCCQRPGAKGAARLSLGSCWFLWVRGNGRRGCNKMGDLGMCGSRDGD